MQSRPRWLKGAFLYGRVPKPINIKRETHRHTRVKKKKKKPMEDYIGKAKKGVAALCSELLLCVNIRPQRAHTDVWPPVLNGWNVKSRASSAPDDR